MARRRPKFTPEYRAEAVRLVRASPDTVRSIARDLSISVWTLRNWVKKAARPLERDALAPNERQELAQLRRDVRQLREERDILKKATAFFAKHSE